MVRLASLGGVILFIPFVCANAAEPLRLLVTQQNSAPHLGPVNSYGLAIGNLMDYSIAIQREILIEKQTASGWKRQGVIQAVNTCDKFGSSNTPVRLDPHALGVQAPEAVHAHFGDPCPVR